MAEDNIVALAEDLEREQKAMTQSQALIELASTAELFHDSEGKCYATYPVGDHRETSAIRGKGLRSWLRHRFYEATGKAPASQAFTDALAVLEARADFEGPERPVFVRVAEYHGGIYLDLANECWEVVEITAAGWRVVSDPPVRFVRPRGMLPLPAPVAGGSLSELGRFLNTGGEAALRLCVAWLVAALRPGYPFLILVLQGEQGSAKSTTARALRMLIDPNQALIRSAPKDDRDIMIAAQNAWALAFDNLSGLAPWLSDALCRLSTGGGLATRELYSDADEVIFEAQRPVILNGIDDLLTRHDLIDRALAVWLPTIPEAARRDEALLWSDFEDARPRLLGALLDAVSCALGRLPTVELSRLPRMADAAKWITAAEPALGWPTGSFIDAYTGNRAEAVSVGLEASPVAVAVQSLMENADQWSGTATALLAVIGRYAAEDAKRSRAWPKTPRKLSSELRRLAPALRQVGLSIEWTRSSGQRELVLTRESTESSVTSVTNVMDSDSPQVDRIRGIAGHDATVTQDDATGTTHDATVTQQKIQRHEKTTSSGRLRDAHDANDEGIPLLSASAEGAVIP